jgi:hypothetical protein
MYIKAYMYCIWTSQRLYSKNSMVYAPEFTKTHLRQLRSQLSTPTTKGKGWSEVGKISPYWFSTFVSVC